MDCAVNLPEDKERETRGLNNVRCKEAFLQVQMIKPRKTSSLNKERAGGGRLHLRGDPLLGVRTQGHMPTAYRRDSLSRMGDPHVYSQAADWELEGRHVILAAGLPSNA